MGVLSLALRLAWSFHDTIRLRRLGTSPVPPSFVTRLDDVARRFGIRRAVTLLESALVRTPTVLGALKPVILLPASALTGLTPPQLDAILAHELAHIRRHDYAVNLFQTLVETLLFYHPAVWWLSSRIRAERELCCDDLALTACSDRATYARALALLAEHYAAASPLSMASTGGHLLRRIRRILGREPQHRVSPMRWAAGLLAATLVLGVGFLSYTGNVAAQASGAEDAQFVDTPLPERTLTFPSDRSVGVVLVHSWGSATADSWEQLAQALGSVKVPAGKMVRLEVAKTEKDLRWLAVLAPDALQAIRIGNADVEDMALPFVGKWKSIRDVSFDGSGLGDEALASLAGSGSIESISVAGTKVADAGVKQLRGLPRIGRLNLAETSITDAAMTAIGAMTTLKEIRLPAGVTDAGLAPLAGLPQVELADLGRCSLKGDGARAFGGIRTREEPAAAAIGDG